MCAYKLVTVKFKWWGLQTKVENLIHEVSLSFAISIRAQTCTSLLKFSETVILSKRRGSLLTSTGSCFVILISGWS